MIVKEIMKSDVATCGLTDDIAAVASLMRDRHCGFVPVIDSHGAVAGVLTDRDLCLYAADKTRSMAHISVREAMSHPVFSCFADDNVKAAIAEMAMHHVRRLPVLDREGHLLGVLSIDDVVHAPRRRGAPSAEEIVAALKDISAPHGIELPA